MSYKIFLTKQAQKDLSKLPSQKKEIFKTKVALLVQEPFSGKKLIGEFSGLYSLRLWPYRIIYQVNKKRKEVTVITVEHRQGAYKK